MKSAESKGEISFEWDDKKRLKTVILNNVSPNDMGIITPFVSNFINVFSKADTNGVMIPISYLLC